MASLIDRLILSCILMASVVAAAAKDSVIMTVAGRDVGSDEFLRMYEKNSIAGVEQISIQQYAEMFADYKLKVAEAEDMHLDTAAVFVAELEACKADLAGKYRSGHEYERLVSEYREGMLLFEINRLKLWDPVASDTVRLAGYFENHRDRYQWGELHFKGYVVMAESDSLVDKAVEYLDQQGTTADVKNLSRLLRRKFGTAVRIEPLLSPKGVSEMVDYIGFGGKYPDPSGRWRSFRAWQGRIIDRPEEMADVRAAVSNDLQLELEDQWLSDLRQRYKVKINKKAIAKLGRQR